MSAMIILVTNKLTLRDHHQIQYPRSDNDLIAEGLSFLTRQFETDEKWLRTLHDACYELNRRADISAAQFWLDPGGQPPIAPWTVPSIEVGPEENKPVFDLLRAFIQAEDKPLTSVI
jgi:hypothetical protein